MTAVVLALRHSLQIEGVAIARSVLRQDQLRSLLAAIRPDDDAAPGAVRHGSGQTYGVRGLLASRPELVAHLADLGVNRFVSEAFGRPAFPIDAIFFDKHADANWSVPAHQDVVVPVPRRAHTDLARPPRERDGVMYGELPEDVLSDLLAVRVHFDDSDEDAGALRVLPGTHRGRIPESEISSFPSSAFRTCCALAGDLLFIKPLLVHRSGRSAKDAHRRVLHVLYAPPMDGMTGSRTTPPN